MDFKKVIITGITALILLNSSCLRNFHAENHGWVYNSTPDTVYLTGIRTFFPDTLKIPPFERVLIYNSYQATMIENFTKNHTELDSAAFWRGQDTIVWFPPFEDLPATEHSFYNKNSWESIRGGAKNKYISETFTITESDFIKKQ